MKTPEEIKKGLECCPVCNRSCAYNKGIDCYAELHYDALAYIQQLEDGIDRIYKLAKDINVPANQPKWTSINKL